MPNPFDKIKLNGEQFETPVTIKQVETHLIFGPLSRHFPTAYVFFIGGLLSLIGGFFALQMPLGEYIGNILGKLVFLFVPLILLKMTLRQQAIIGWLTVKISLGLAAFMMATIGAGVSFQQHKADAWPNLFLGLIWIPGLEFVPKITPQQRYLTLARIALSLPCIYFGVESGNWHW